MKSAADKSHFESSFTDQWKSTSTVKQVTKNTKAFRHPYHSHNNNNNKRQFDSDFIASMNFNCKLYNFMYSLSSSSCTLKSQ